MNKMTFIADMLGDVIAVQRTMRTALVSLSWRRDADSELSEILVCIETELNLPAVRLWLESEPDLAYLAQTLQEAVSENPDGFRENLRAVSRTWSAVASAPCRCLACELGEPESCTKNVSPPGSPIRVNQ